MSTLHKPPFKQYTDMGRLEFMAMVESVISPRNARLVHTMYKLSKYGHRNQMRDGDPPRRYFDHPKELAIIALTELKTTDWKLLTVLLGHDLPEDSYMLGMEEIEILFGEEIAINLRLLTKNPKNGYLERIIQFGDIRVIKAKLIDRLHNVRTLSGCTPEKRTKQIKETTEHYLPLANLLHERLVSEEKWQALYLRDEILRACGYYAP